MPKRTFRTFKCDCCPRTKKVERPFRGKIPPGWFLLKRNANDSLKRPDIGRKELLACSLKCIRSDVAKKHLRVIDGESLEPE